MNDLAVYDVFLSHNRRQKRWVRQVVGLLRHHGLRVFFDEDSILPGEDIVSALERAVAASHTLVLVLSRSSLFSKWVAFETTLRLYDDPESTLSRLIPVLVEPVDRTLIRPAVRRLDAVDLTDPQTRESEFFHFLASLGISNVTASELPEWPDSSAVRELYISDIASVLSWRWTGKELLDKLIELDYAIFPDLTREHEGQTEQWVSIFMDHPDTWRLITTPDHEVVGYWHMLPLFPDDHRAAVNGELSDGDITTDRVRFFELPGTYSLYVVAFGLQPKYRKTKAYQLLLDSLFEVVLELAREGVLFDNIVANAFTGGGEAMCKSFGLHHLRPHRQKGQIYMGSMRGVLALDVCNRYTELRAVYSI